LVTLSLGAHADEMRVVTTGSISFEGCCAGSFSFGGDGLEVDGHLSSTGITPWTTFFDVEAGDPITATNRWTGLDIISGLGSRAAIDGSVYSPVFLGGDISLTTGPLIIPEESGSTLTLHAPFRFAPGARLLIFDDPWFAGSASPVAGFGLSGGGTAAIRFNAIPGVADRYQAASTVWSFSSQPSAVPEPGSLVLLGVGLAGLAAARRRRRGRMG
jgi:hypothetical protein